MSSGKKYTIEEYLNIVMNNHNNKYDYSLVKYINSTTSVKIICPIHGEFKQKPYHHILKSQSIFIN